MELTTKLIRETAECTISELSIDGLRQCYILQDGKTGGGLNGKGRIPAGRYRITLRNFAEHHAKYLAHYTKLGIPSFHKGMLWLRDVPNYDAILIHVGNSPKDTLGCLLTGTTVKAEGCFVGGSRVAYDSMYPKVRDAILAGEEVWITVTY